MIPACMHAETAFLLRSGSIIPANHKG
jgi:hypothetical protein